MKVPIILKAAVVNVMSLETLGMWVWVMWVWVMWVWVMWVWVMWVWVMWVQVQVHSASVNCEKHHKRVEHWNTQNDQTLFLLLYLEISYHIQT